MSFLPAFLQTIRREVKALQALLVRDYAGLDALVDQIVQSNAKLVVTGLGKSGIIGRKIAATLSSTGTPSVFLHASEACHGDVGMVRPPDIVLAVSYSGETEELLRIIPYIKHHDICLIAITGNLRSSLARHADYLLDASIPDEADPFCLAPTASSTAALALGDALAMALMDARHFKVEDFASCHPSGSLGRQLLTTVGQVMRTDPLPLIQEDTLLQVLPAAIRQGRHGLVAIKNALGQICGVITDGDLRRFLECNEITVPWMARDIMTPSPKQVPTNTTLHQAREIMIKFKITSLLVVDSGQLKGIIQIYDI